MNSKQITKFLQKAKIIPNKLSGANKFLVDVGNVEYYETEAIRKIMQAREMRIGRPKITCADYQKVLAEACTLLALSAVTLEEKCPPAIKYQLDTAHFKK